MGYTLRPVIWLGNTRKKMKEFPKQVHIDIGAAVMAAQCGETAEHVKPFTGVGSGVFEIAERSDTNAYRLVYAVQSTRTSMCCMPFKRNPRPALPHREKTWS